jgi:Gluconate 2-dehydrogenase subunit 3
LPRYDSSHLPRQRRGITPQMVGRYPDYDVLETVDTWDHVTRKAVMSRLDAAGPLRFFSAGEEPALRALCDTLSHQHQEPRVPVAEMVDRKYAEGEVDGYRYADMPDDRETWHLVLRGMEEVAQRRFGKPFHHLDVGAREGICQDFSEGTLQGDTWESLNVKRAFSVVMRGVASTFYSHPWAWNEIGFGGPAYPRGFMRFGEASAREPFEGAEAFAEDPVRDVEARHE